MLRLVVYLLAVVVVASGLGWLADRPGTLQVTWQGYDIETTVFRAVVILAIVMASAVFLWSIARTLWHSPAIIGERILNRRKKRGLDALSSGMIAIGAGDKILANRYALLARNALPHEPMTQLLRAQAAQLSGDRATARRIYEAMLSSPETEQLGLRGLYLEAEREGSAEAARQLAGRALKTNPKLGWSADALFDMQCQQKDWAGALETLDHAKRTGNVEKAVADRKRAVLLTAKAIEAEENGTDQALTFALEAHALAPDLVPAAAVAGRIYASRGNTAKAAKVLQKTWVKSPHPDLATAYAHARIGDSTRDRLDRVRQLAALNPHSIESTIAIATTAIEARMFDEARYALEPLLANRLTQRVATLMARIEAGESGDKGRVREWLARAVTASRDPVWMADGVVSDHWEAISPVTGKLDAYQWRVPVESRDEARTEIVTSRLEELLAIDAATGSTANQRAEAELTLTAAMEHVPASTVSSTLSEPPNPAQAEPEPIRLQPVTERAIRGRADEAAQIKPVRNGSDEATITATPQSRLTANKPTSPVQPTSHSQKEPKSGDAKLFVAPRAPDDPGPDTSEDETTASYSKRPFRAIK
ncbi:MAG: heme biosynthesis protein HemY [Hyphomicrobium sp.]|nr:MAG: heme biosynthesis protein HemY [Hyphomicrobium sp.]PPD00690.1 MAG: heme biosynthesis protein HemY [Hyphomicrobium sp.]